jgi:large subunit ribosomal protein L11
MLISNARRMGILIERNVDPEEYRQFLEERAKFLIEKRKRLDEEKEAKILRTTV